ncbi:MetQ/NlpA family ABC transporter substrate-binding protein [Terrisporobacter vanillatitrophus]
MKKRLLALVMCLSLGTTFLVGCGKDNAQAGGEKTTIKLGVRGTSIDEAEIAKSKLEEKGYKVEIVTFDDNIAPNTALAEGSIDANMYQHEPYLDDYNKNEGTKLVMVKPKVRAPIFGLYSEEYTDIKDIKDGSTIGLCNDSSNQARGLKLLEELGFIKLDESVESPTMYDIAENPKNLKFIEAEMISLPQSLSDVAAIACAGAHIQNASKDPQKLSLANSNDEEEYAVGVVVNEKDKDTQWAKDIADAYRSKEIKTYIEENYKGVFIALF